MEPNATQRTLELLKEEWTKDLRAERNELQQALSDLINHWVLTDEPDEAVLNRAVDLLDQLQDDENES